MKNQKFDIMKKYTFRTFAGKKYILDLDPEITVLECKEIFNKESASSSLQSKADQINQSQEAPSIKKGLDKG